MGGDDDNDGVGSALVLFAAAGGAILPGQHARPWKISLTQPVKVETAISQEEKGQLRR